MINRYEIKEPVWMDNSIGIAEFRLKNDLLVDITYKNKNNQRVFPDTYAIKNPNLVDRTYQLNFGGNTDFLNMLERSRLKSKKISKTNAVQSQLEKELPTDDVHIGPSDHVPWLEDRKWAYIRLEGTSWGDVPLNVELKLEVEDSPNSAGVAIDAIRCAKIAIDKGISGAIDAPSAYFMKSPPNQMRDDDARKAVEDFSEIE